VNAAMEAATVLDAGPREPRGVTFATSVGRRSAGHLSTARRPATTRGSSVWAAVPPARRMGPRRHRSPHSDRRSHGPRGARTSPRARQCPSDGARAGGDRALYSTDSRPAPIEIPIPEQMCRISTLPCRSVPLPRAS
jgi:hypothetical protein